MGDKEVKEVEDDNQEEEKEEENDENKVIFRYQVLAPWSAHARPPTWPPILQSHLLTSPPTAKNSYLKFSNKT